MYQLEGIQLHVCVYIDCPVITLLPFSLAGGVRIRPEVRDGALAALQEAKLVLIEVRMSLNNGPYNKLSGSRGMSSCNVCRWFSTGSDSDVIYMASHYLLSVNLTM